MRFSDELRAACAGPWRASAGHPFVRGIGDGSLPVERFRFYIAQDYAFLVDYSRFLALAVAKSADPDTMGRFAALLNETLNTEMALHRGYCARFRISEAELGATEPSPTTYAYTSHLLRVAYTGDLAAIVAAILPCQWGYAEIGRALAAAGPPADQPLYAEWIAMYASPEFAALADWLRELLDRLGAAATADQRARLHAIFRTSSRYERAFWEAAYTMEAWPD